MNENSARFAAAIVGGVGLLSIVVSLGLGLAGNNGTALFFLLITIVCLIGAIFLSRYYSRLQQSRWRQELGAHEQELDRLFGEAQSPQPGGGKHGERET